MGRLQRENKYLHDLVTSWREEKEGSKPEKSQRKIKIEKTASMPMEKEISISSIKLDTIKKKEEMRPVEPVDELRETVIEIKRTEPFTADKKNS